MRDARRHVSSAAREVREQLLPCDHFHAALPFVMAPRRCDRFFILRKVSGISLFFDQSPPPITLPALTVETPIFFCLKNEL